MAAAPNDMTTRELAIACGDVRAKAAATVATRKAEMQASSARLAQAYAAWRAAGVLVQEATDGDRDAAHAKYKEARSGLELVKLEHKGSVQRLEAASRDEASAKSSEKEARKMFLRQTLTDLEVELLQEERALAPKRSRRLALRDALENIGVGSDWASFDRALDAIRDVAVESIGIDALLEEHDVRDL